MIHKKVLTYLLLITLLCLVWSCVVPNNSYTGLAPGKWRGVMYLENNKQGLGTRKNPAQNFEEISAGELPFNFEVKYITKDSFIVEFINGEERIPVDQIKIGRDRATAKDTIQLFFPIFDTYLKGIYEAGILQGEWVVASKNNYSIPFFAKQGQDYRFTELKKTPSTDISGSWEVIFDPEKDKEKAIGEFKQQGNYLTGTFRTETGDYRFLEGTIQANKFYLSCFDGSHAFLFEGKLTDNDNITGVFLSGKHHKAIWEAKRNPNATLSDPYTLTKTKGTDSKLDFTFPNEKGQNIHFADSKSKVKLVQISGTWCPNCKDETNFLVEYLKNKKPNDLEIFGLYFERYKEKEKALQHLATYKEKMNIPYHVLWGGNANRDSALVSVPVLESLKSFPTLLVVDKENKIRKIHTGFDGPATSKYAEFKKEFYDMMDNLLKE